MKNIKTRILETMDHPMTMRELWLRIGGDMYVLACELSELRQNKQVERIGEPLAWQWRRVTP